MPDTAQALRRKLTPEDKEQILAFSRESVDITSTARKRGIFANVQHIMVPPQAGFSVYVQNHNPFSPAFYRIRSRMWACG